mmetsp:Transcript_26506/g.57172  ORF Transcript_26506/g.57172 Transcript_26506/m.57172 type:complete len:328 (+) Transcript_26506:115-1098(+)
MIRQAATALLPVGGSLSRRALLPIISAHTSGSLNSTTSRRMLASSTKVPPTTTARPAASVSQINAESQQAIEKAERMHAELSEMIAARKPSSTAEKESFGAGFLKFLKASKPQIFNIFFAFVCVLLAYQIHGMRAGIKKLLTQQEEKDAEIDRLRGILVTLSDDGDAGTGTSGNEEEKEDGNDSFSMKLARKCAGVVRNIFEESEKKVGYSWILGKKLASGDAMELERLIDEMHPIIVNDVQSAVGDARFTPDEMKERSLAALKEEPEPKQHSESSASNRNGKSDAQMGGLMELLEEVHSEDLTDGKMSGEDGTNTSTKVRRTRYSF